MYSVKLGSDKIYYGENAVEGLRNLKSDNKKAFIIMSGTLLDEIGLLSKVTNILDEMEFKYEVFTDVEPEPSFTTVMKGAEKIKAFEPDWIIGFGGGSAMDAAKAMWVFYENPQCTKIEEVAAPNEFKYLREKARLCCIATSAGTGSEVTRASMIKDTEIKKKYSVRCMQGRLIPDIAILDPVFTVSLPKSLTASTGMDAITHAIESYVSPHANPFSKAMSYQSFIETIENLPICFKDGKNMEARAKMLAASCMGGIAFSNCGLGICHSIAHSFGVQYNIGHGLANAIVLPYVIEFNSVDENIAKQYDTLAYSIKSNSLHETIKDLNKQLELPTKMQDVMNNSEEFEKDLDALVEKAMCDVCTKVTCRMLSDDEMRNLIRVVYYGK